MSIRNLITSIIPSYGTSINDTAPSTLYPSFDTQSSDSSRKIKWRLLFKVLLVIFGTFFGVGTLSFFVYIWFIRFTQSHVDEVESAQQFLGGLPIQNNLPPF